MFCMMFVLVIMLMMIVMMSMMFLMFTREKHAANEVSNHLTMTKVNRQNPIAIFLT